MNIKFSYLPTENRDKRNNGVFLCQMLPVSIKSLPPVSSSIFSSLLPKRTSRYFALVDPNIEVRLKDTKRAVEAFICSQTLKKLTDKQKYLVIFKVGTQNMYRISYNCKCIKRITFRYFMY